MESASLHAVDEINPATGKGDERSRVESQHSHLRELIELSVSFEKQPSGINRGTSKPGKFE